MSVAWDVFFIFFFFFSFLRGVMNDFCGEDRSFSLSIIQELWVIYVRMGREKKRERGSEDIDFREMYLVWKNECQLTQ